MTDLNDIKILISTLAGLQGLSGEWSINQDINIDEELSKEVGNLKVELDLLSKAISEKDMVAAKFALVMVRLCSLNLSNLFLDIFDDVEKVGWSEGGSLPGVPDGYQVPEHYNYKS